ncbi:hypothetical protein NPIL_218091 [Nephila pilipes]|uniref:Uncharacterized protein n=1 Tax=Nephila pilipes TaxID=299642 RepID=A0A8X6P2K7_NEPPI|nr:hypothetical protein NPIL_218091 [Nephila pilipes]
MQGRLSRLSGRNSSGLWLEDLVGVDMQTKFGELCSLDLPPPSRSRRKGFLALIMVLVNEKPSNYREGLSAEHPWTNQGKCSRSGIFPESTIIHTFEKEKYVK